ncbi:unnamed protein product [Moneuplotes crassus]|uniref:Uncharacterized protein n=1 Tax=Euplotes crassus TaxID=5936 RepID=A0AAD1Y1E4_EUPCR|nr:unnamed protein product [Moneuplotes crassus]
MDNETNDDFNVPLQTPSHRLTIIQGSSIPISRMGPRSDLELDSSHIFGYNTSSEHSHYPSRFQYSHSSLLTNSNLARRRKTSEEIITKTIENQQCLLEYLDSTDWIFQSKLNIFSVNFSFYC